ncbi:MAG: hypothetical protein Q8K30_06190 [Candidatus Gracilibacteria bacterium]|nr:hypothetical protein [Candidatus Gracilibacteria bacterium]
MKKFFTLMSIFTLLFSTTLSSYAATTSVEQTAEFAIKSINVLSLNAIELTFTEALEDSEDAVREFKIVNKSDSLDIFNVVDSMLNPKDNTKLLLALDKDTQKTKEYEVTVIAIKSASGNNIESGIDSTEAFVVSETEYPTIEEVINNYGNEPLVELNAAMEVSEPTNTSTNLAGTETSTGEESLDTVATEANALPATGPEHIIILLLSILLGLGAFMLKSKKS